MFAVLSALSFAITYIFRKQATKFVPFQFAFLMESFVYLLAPIIMFFLLPSAVKKAAISSTNGILFGLLASIFVVGGVALNYMAFKNGSVSKVVAIVGPGQIVFGVLLGLILFKEHLSLIQITGVILSIIGVILITK